MVPYSNIKIPPYGQFNPDYAAYMKKFGNDPTDPNGGNTPRSSDDGKEQTDKFQIPLAINVMTNTKTFVNNFSQFLKLPNNSDLPYYCMLDTPFPCIRLCCVTVTHVLWLRK